MEMKRCSRCGETKAETGFYRNRQWRDGFHPYCKTCILAYQRARRALRIAKTPGKWRWKREAVRHDYFTSIDMPMKAYVMGFIAADGNILPTHHRVTVEISVKDRALLEQLRDVLAPGAAITTRRRTGRDSCIFAFVSRQIIEDLNRFGIGARKSTTLSWPPGLPAQYERAFILGYFDGDGSITYHQRGTTCYPYLALTSGSRTLLTEIAEVIERNTGVRPGGPWLKHGTCYTLRAAGKSARTIDAWLHSDDMGLARKRLS